MVAASRRVGFVFFLSLVVLAGQGVPVAAISLGRPAATAATQAVDTTELRGDWRFDEGSGTTAGDSSGHGNDGTVSGAAWITGKTGKALKFDGVDGGVQISNDATLESTAGLSIRFWFKAWSKPAEGTVILAKGARDCEGSSYRVHVGQGGGIAFTVSVGGYDLSTSPWNIDPATVWNGAWHQLTATFLWNGYAFVTLYLDGAIVSPTEQGPWAPIDYGLPDGNDLFLGRPPLACTGQLPFVGSLDEVQVWGRELSKEEVAALTEPIGTTITLTQDSETSIHGVPVSFTARVSPAPSLGGVVTLLAQPDGYHAGRDEAPIVLETLTFSSWSRGLARILWNQLPVGTHAVTARYEGTGAYADSSSEAVSHSVTMRSTVTSLTSTGSSALPGDRVTLTATVSPTVFTPEGDLEVIGTVSFLEIVDSSEVVLGSAPLNVWTETGMHASLTISSLALGTHAIVARFDGTRNDSPSTSLILYQTIAKGSTTTTLETPGYPIQAHHPVTLTATVAPRDASGTVTFEQTFNGTTSRLGVATLSKGQSVLELPMMAIGTHAITARYDGSARYLSSKSLRVTQEIVPDIVEVSDTGVSAALFYPIVDGYEDTVTIHGTLGETARVQVRIFSEATGRRVRYIDLGQRSGSYSVSWDGRDDDGAIQAAGDYRVTQAFTDAFGTTRGEAAYTTVSLKKLYTITESKTLYGDQFKAAGHSGTGWVSTSASRYYRGVKLYSGSGAALDYWAGVAYSVTLPAAMKYTALRFSVYGTGSPPARIGLQDWTLCGGWDVSCFNGWVYTVSGAWISSKSDRLYAHISSGDVVRGAVVVDPKPGMYWDIAKVRFTYTYVVLK